MTTNALEKELEILRIEVENLRMLKGILSGLLAKNAGGMNAGGEVNPVAKAIARRKERKAKH